MKLALPITFVMICGVLGVSQAEAAPKTRRRPAPPAIQAPTIIPGKYSVPLHYVGKSPTWEASGTHALVKAPTMTHRNPQTGQLHSENWWALGPDREVRLDRAAVEFDEKHARSVLVATTGTGTASGTAFYLGNGLVMTNAHVLAWSANMGAPTCRSFAVTVAASQTPEKVGCKSVPFCSPTSDYCIIEMNTLKNGQPIDSVVPAFPLRKTRVVSGEELTAIGNGWDLGLLSSSAPGARYQGNDTLEHYAGTLSGNSGSPLLDQKGNVVGIHFAHDGGDVIDPGAKNYAVPSSWILSEVRAQRPELLPRLRVVEISQAEIAAQVAAARAPLQPDPIFDDLDYAGRERRSTDRTRKNVPTPVASSVPSADVSTGE